MNNLKYDFEEDFGVVSLNEDCFRFTVSKKTYDHKPNNDESSKFNWVPVDGTIDDLVEYIRNGHALCANFGFDKPFWKGRTKANFVNTPFIFIDIDGGPDSLTIDVLQELFHDSVLEPSIIYESYSHRTYKDGRYKGNRFHLVYVFDEAIGSDRYDLVARYLQYEIEALIDFKIDECSVKSFNQVMYGTIGYERNIVVSHNTQKLSSLWLRVCETFHDAEIEAVADNRKVSSVTDYFSKSDKATLSCISFRDFLLSSDYYFTNSVSHTLNINDFILNRFSHNNRLIFDYRLKGSLFDMFLNNISNKALSNESQLKGEKCHFLDSFTPMPIYVDNWGDVDDVVGTNENIISVFPNWGKMGYFKLHDGQGRKKSLYKAMCKVKLINPDIDKYTLLYNAVFWVYNFTVADKEPIRWRDIFHNVNDVLNKSAEFLAEVRRKGLEATNTIGDEKKSPYV